MKYQPILFKPHEVISTLDRRQTQFRRVIKPQPSIYFADDDKCLIARWISDKQIRSTLWNNGIGFNDFCPYGQVGDRLWVRESFTYWEDDEFGGDYLEYRTGHRVSLGEWEYPHPIYDHCIGRFGKWTPSIHAPRWASRITLEITGVRVERIQDISEEDAIAEGIEPGVKGLSVWKNYQSCSSVFSEPIKSFASLWNSVYGTWDVNPWVWVVEFKRVEG